MSSKSFPSADHLRKNLAIAIALVLALILRLSLLDHQTGDTTAFVNWYDYIKTHHYFAALKDSFSDYSPAYLYLLTLAVMLGGGLAKVTAIKLITFPFELLSAFLSYKIVQLKYPQDSLPLLAFFTILFAPTLILNGSYWSQCDILYTTGLIACIYSLCLKRENWAMVSFGIGFALKQQAVFLFPLLIILAVKKYISLKSFLLIPITYLLLLVPAWLIGRPVKSLLSVYTNQFGMFQALTLNAPNFYQWIPNEFYSRVAPLGIGLTAIILAIFTLTMQRIKFKITPEIIIQLGLISVMIMPFCLPKMHDRYFFPADIISILYGFYFPRYFFVPVAISVVSLMSYLPFLLGQVIIPLNILSLVLGAVILALFYHLQETLYPQSIVNSNETP